MHLTTIGYIWVLTVLLGGQPLRGVPYQDPAEGLEDPGLMEAFFDGLLAGQLEAYDIAGAGLAVVRNGEMLLAKGYGLADAGQGRPASADTTLFRMASISKLFTWTAVMQLAEQGRLDLRRDVNAYLDTFQIPAFFPQPITIEHLMSHTSGFEDLVLGIGALRQADVLSLEDFLKTRMPRRIRPPGVVTAYSNYGTALAGYIVQRVSGRPFESYIEEAIFQPLGMIRSSFRQPPPGPLGRDVSRGHIFRQGVFLPRDFEFVNGIAPAGALSSTVTDMARFMIAHLEGGAFGGRRILAESTVRRMHSRLFNNDPRVCGNSHGFWERRINGRRLLGHGGDTWLFHSQLILIPEERAGLLVVYNSQTAASPARDELVQVFMDKYFPSPPEAGSPRPTRLGELDPYVGWYGLSRNAESTLEKALGLLLVIRVSAAGEQRLLTRWPAGLGSRQWIQVEPGVFHQVGGRDKLVFRTDGRGRSTYAFLDSLPLMAGVRLTGVRNPALHWALEGICFFLFLTALVWPMGWVARKCRRPGYPDGHAPRAARLSAFLFCLFHLVFFICLVLTMLKPEEFMLGVPPPLRVGLWLSYAVIPFTAVSVVFAVLAWRRKYWTACGRIHYALVAAAGVFQLLFLRFWNFLRFP